MKSFRMETCVKIDKRETNVSGEVSDNRTMNTDLDRCKNKNEAEERKFPQYGEEFYEGFPRGEYQARFEGTTAFDMSTPVYWAAYFRSTSISSNRDRVATIRQKKPMEKRKVNVKQKLKINPTKTGTMKSPWETYKSIFAVDEQQMNVLHSNSNSPSYYLQNNRSLYLYDELLRYKHSICDIIIKEIEKRNFQYIDVYCKNIYPCLMIKVKALDEIHTENFSLCKILMIICASITNAIAFKKGIPTEIVNRASFGHNIPSVSTTGSSFRISIGLVPKIYAEKVLVESLTEFNDKIPTLLHAKLGFEAEIINRINEKILNYNAVKQIIRKGKNPKTVDQWEEDDTVLKLLCKTGSSTGKTVSGQITKVTEYVDLLGNYIHTELIDGDGNLLEPLKEMLRHFDIVQDKVVLTNIRDDDYIFKKKSFKHIDKEIQYDNRFWEVIEKISLAFEKLNIHGLTEAVKNKEMLGLYSILDDANFQLIKNCSNQQSSDGYGSDSDCEVYDENDNSVCYSKKITLATGMRAITCAQFLILYQCNGTTDSQTKIMYYETEEATNRVYDILSKLNMPRASNQKLVRFIDLNHCTAADQNALVILENIRDEIVQELRQAQREYEEIIVLDYTATTATRIQEAIKLFIPHVKIILLVNGGLKNEQIGADLNPYGALRIITRDEHLLNRLYLGLKNALDENEKLPKELHNIRRAYKSVGAAVSNEAIFDNNGWIFKRKNTIENEYTNEFRFEPNFIKIFELFFSDKYKEEVENLIDFHMIDLNDMISWDVKKIQFLGSKNVKRVVEEGNVTFKSIEQKYDGNPGLLVYSNHLWVNNKLCYDYNGESNIRGEDFFNDPNSKLYI